MNGTLGLPYYNRIRIHKWKTLLVNNHFCPSSLSSNLSKVPLKQETTFSMFNCNLETPKLLMISNIRHFSKLTEFSANFQLTNDWTCFVEHKL